MEDDRPQGRPATPHYAQCFDRGGSRCGTCGEVWPCRSEKAARASLPAAEAVSNVHYSPDPYKEAARLRERRGRADDPLAIADLALAIVDDQQAHQGLHCDVYSVRPEPGTLESELVSAEPIRRVDDPGMLARLHGLPYLNGYTITTKMHGDDECEAHRPRLRVRRLAEGR